MSSFRSIALVSCIVLDSIASAVREAFPTSLEDAASLQLETQQLASMRTGKGATISSLSSQIVLNSSGVLQQKEFGPPTCNTSGWHDKLGDCGPCHVLVQNFRRAYLTCEGYCASVSRTCTSAREEGSCTGPSLDCHTPFDSNTWCECGEALKWTTNPRVVAIESRAIPGGYLKVVEGDVLVEVAGALPLGQQSLFNLSSWQQDESVSIRVLSETWRYIGAGLSKADPQVHSAVPNTTAAPRFKMVEPSGTGSHTDKRSIESVDLPGFFFGVRGPGKKLVAENASKRTKRFSFRLHELVDMMLGVWHYDHVAYNITRGPTDNLLRCEESTKRSGGVMGLLHQTNVSEFEGIMSSEDGAKVAEVLLRLTLVDGEVEVWLRKSGPVEAHWESMVLTKEPQKWRCTADSLCRWTAMLVVAIVGLVCFGAILFWWRQAGAACSALGLFLWFLAMDIVLCMAPIRLQSMGQGERVTPISPMYWVNFVLPFLVLAGLFEVLVVFWAGKVSKNQNGGPPSMDSTPTKGECGEASECPEVGTEVSPLSIYGNLSIGMTPSCLVFFAQWLLFVMYIDSVIVTVEDFPDNCLTLVLLPLFSLVTVEDYQDKPRDFVNYDGLLALVQCVIIQMSLEKLLGGHFGLQFQRVWSHLLRAKRFRVPGDGSANSAVGGWAHSWRVLGSACLSRLGFDRASGASQSAEEAGSASANSVAAAASHSKSSPDLDDGVEVYQLEVFLRMCMAFTAQSVERRFVLYTLPIMILAKSTDPADFVKDILTYAYISSLDLATNTETTLTLDPPLAKGPVHDTDGGPLPDAEGGRGQDGDARGAAPAPPPPPPGAAGGPADGEAPK